MREGQRQSSGCLLTVNEAARFLNVTESCLRRMVYERRISAVKIGRCVRFSPEYLEQYVLSHTRPVIPKDSDTTKFSKGEASDVQ
jgi:excisionase family DNA binding protein